MALLQVMKMSTMIKWIWLRLAFHLLLVTMFSKALPTPVSPLASSQITLQSVPRSQFEGGCPNSCLNDLSMFCDAMSKLCIRCDHYCDKGKQSFSLEYCKSNCPDLFNSMISTLHSQKTLNSVTTVMATSPLLTKFHTVENHDDPQAGFATDNNGIVTEDHAEQDAAQLTVHQNQWTITVIVISCVVVAVFCTMLVAIIIKLCAKKYYTPCPTSTENQDATARVVRKGFIPNLKHICCACFTDEKRPQEETEMEPPKNTGTSV